MKHNYQADTDAVINALQGEKPKLLLHSCCGPCSSYVLEYLTRHFNVKVLFYNPNIQPVEEYEKRLYWQKQVLEWFPQVEPAECEYSGESFVKISKGLENSPEGGERCTKCFELRLRETAKLAAELGFDYFCTTLTVSPHKDAERINKIALALSEEYGVKWLSSDFKKREGYKRSIELSAEYGLYRQDYCGCSFSISGQRKAREQTGS